jgi:hypothetical protein
VVENTVRALEVVRAKDPRIKFILTPYLSIKNPEIKSPNIKQRIAIIL